MDTIKAILTKPLDGEPEGTFREFDSVDFARLKTMGAVRESSETDGLRTDGPTVAEYVAAGYKPENYPPSGYAVRSTAEEIASAITHQNTPDVPIADNGTEAPAKAAPATLNKMAPPVSNKSGVKTDPLDHDGDGKKGGSVPAKDKQ